MSSFIYAVLVAFVVFLLVIGIRVLGSTELGRVKKVIPLFTLNGTFTILLIVAAIVVFLCGVYFPMLKSPQPSEIGTMFWKNWLWSFIFVGILYFLVEKIKDATMKKTSRTFLSIVVFLVAIGFPVWNWVVEQSRVSTPASRQVEIPLASAPISTWPKIILQPGGKSERIPVPPGMRAMVDGSRLCVHTVYSDGHECVRASEGEGSGTVCPDGQVTGAYVTNEAKETNIVSYAFAQ